MPTRTIHTRISRLLEHRRHVSARPGRPPKGPTQPPDEDERTIQPAGRPEVRTSRTRGRSFRRPVSIFAAVVLGVVLFAPGARAHVGETFGHLWNQHIAPRLASSGTINAAGNPMDWTKLKGVPAGLADGLDHRVDQAVGTSGGGPNPSSVFQFFGAPVTVTVTSPSQRILVTSHNGFGAAALGANALNLYICSRQLPSGTLTPVGNGILGITLPASTRVPMGMSKILQLAPGAYQVGLCGTGGSGWSNNDWGSTTALVIDV